MNRMASGKYLKAALLPWLLCLPLMAQLRADKQNGAETGVDYVSMRQEIVKFEATINNVLSSTFSSSPFALVQKTKGVYLQGYGMTFDFLINIHRAVINTPFGQISSHAGITPELKKRRIDDLIEKLIRVLQNNDNAFRQLRNEDCVTIVAFFEDRNFPNEPNENKTIVLSVLKKDLDQFRRKDDNSIEFKQRMRIVEY